MDIKRLINDDDAVSPVIGVILMVAITVILAAVIATFVLGLGENLSNTAPQASFSFDYENDTSDTLAITHDGGDTVESDALSVTQTGAELSAGSISSSNSTIFDSVSSGKVSAGNSVTANNVTFNATSGETLDLSSAKVRVVYNSEGSSATLGEWSGPSA